MKRTCLLIAMVLMLALTGCGGGGDGNGDGDVGSNGDADGAVQGDLMQPGDADGMQPDHSAPDTTASCANQDMLQTDNLPLGSLLFHNSTFGWGGEVFEQCLLTRTVDGEVQHGWSWDWPLDGKGTPRGLPSAIYGQQFWTTEPTPGSEIPIQVSQIPQLEALDASFQVELTADPDSSFFLQLELLFNSVDPPKPEAVVAQVVIHLDHQNDPFEPGPPQPSATIGQHVYDVGHNPLGHFGPLTVLRSRVPQYGGTIDLKAVLQEVVDRGFVLPQSYLGSIDLNTLVMEGEGQVWVLEYEVEVR